MIVIALKILAVWTIAGAIVSVVMGRRSRYNPPAVVNWTTDGRVFHVYNREGRTWCGMEISPVHDHYGSAKESQRRPCVRCFDRLSTYEQTH